MKTCKCGENMRIDFQAWKINEKKKNILKVVYKNHTNQYQSRKYL